MRMGTVDTKDNLWSSTPPPNVIVTKQNKNPQTETSVILIWSFAFCFLLRAIPSGKRCCLVLFSNVGNGTEGRTSDITSKNVRGTHVLPFLFPPALSWRGQYSRRSHYITKLLPKLMEPFATSLGLAQKSVIPFQAIRKLGRMDHWHGMGSPALETGAPKLSKPSHSISSSPNCPRSLSSTPESRRQAILYLRIPERRQ